MSDKTCAVCGRPTRYTEGGKPLCKEGHPSTVEAPAETEVVTVLKARGGIASPERVRVTVKPEVQAVREHIAHLKADAAPTPAPVKQTAPAKSAAKRIAPQSRGKK